MLIKARHLVLCLILGVFGYALLPPKDVQQKEEAKEAHRTSAKYRIRFAPGGYMPGRRPQDVGQKLKGLAEVAAEYEKLHPDTDIEFVEVPGSREWLVTQLLGNQAPDVININVEDVWQDVQKGWYVPLDRYLEAPNPFVKEGPGSRQWWDMFKYQAITRGKAAPDGKMYCVTLDMIETGIYYNKDIFRKVGVQPPKDWAEFLSIQQKLQSAGYVPMLVGQGELADWGVDLMFYQMYRGIRDAIDLKSDPLRAGYQKGYLDWDEIAFLNEKGFFTRSDPRWLSTFQLLKDWRKYFVKDLGSTNLEQSFIQQKGAMYWSSSFTVNKLKGDPNLGFDWGVFYLPPITTDSNPYAGGFDQCVIGGAATQFSVTNSAFNDTGDPASSEKLKRVVGFLQFLCLPRNCDRVVNELTALLPNIKGVAPKPELEVFDRILQRDYTMTKWFFTFDLRFNEIWTRMLFLYLQGGISEAEFFDWMEKDVRSACETIVRRKGLDLSKFEPAWQANQPKLTGVEGLPHP
jgi:ABC-type glycerol-3-phosphate transport system substrate-binding protein